MTNRFTRSRTPAPPTLRGRRARYEGTPRRHRRRADGTVRDTVFFGLLAGDWPAVRDGLRARVQVALG